MSVDAGVNAIEKGIAAALAAAGGVTALVPSARHYNMLAPTDAAYPLIVFNLMGSDDEARGFAEDAQSFRYQIKCIAKGDPSVVTAGDCADEIDTAIDQVTITATGMTVYKARRESHLRYMEFDQQNQPIVHAGAVYRLWTHP